MDAPGARPKRPRRRRIGLLGGSFNPAHRGHRQASLMALKRLVLDEVWWLVSPGNPLKDARELAVYSRRCAEAAAVAAHPRIRISTFEQDAGLTFTRDTLAALSARFADTAFVWLMGADNLADIHYWQRWPEIFALMPVAVIDRPGYRYRALASPAAARFAEARVAEADAALLAGLEPPAWTFLSGPLNPLSSTALRARRHAAAASGT